VSGPQVQTHLARQNGVNDEHQHMLLHVWMHLQAAVYSELARIEEQQQNIMQQLAVVKKER
jgi:hypothetical protein